MAEEIIISSKHYCNDIEDVIDGHVLDMIEEVIKAIRFNGYGFVNRWNAEDCDYRQITEGVINVLEDMGFPYRSDGISF